MNKICKRTPYLILGLMLIAVIIFIGCEAENPGEPRANLEPETYISEASPGVTTIISWYGTDKDGRVESFQYRWDDGDWVETEEMTGTFQNIFSDLSDQHTFYVVAGDNRNGWDPTPASVTLSPVTISPETKILEGPQFGSVVGSDVRFAWEGEDKDGRVAGYEYTMDDVSSWTVVDSTVTERLFLNLANGSHTFFVKAVDNLGAKDDSPAQVSFVVKSSGFAPILTNTSPISDGGGWFSGVGVTFSWTVDVSHYEGLLPEGMCTYAFDDSTGFDDDNANMAVPWNPNTSYSAGADAIMAGSHTFYIKARDTNNEVTRMTIDFSSATPTFDKGILLVDDFNWVTDSYADEVDQDNQIAHGFMADYPFTVRPDNAAPLAPDDLAPYSTVILYGDNGYQNQGNGNLLAAYANAGGNLFICGYNLQDLAPSFGSFGMTPAVYGYDTGNYGGMDGQEGTAYENWHIDLPAPYTERMYQRVYEDAANTQSIFAVRGLDEDVRSCGVRADMPLGNVVIVIGQSIPFWDQASADTKAFGEYVLGTEFGESK